MRTPPRRTPCRRAESADGAPGPKSDVAVAALAEGGDQDREGSRGDERSPETLDRPGADERHLAPGKATQERAEREHGKACHEDSPSAEEIGRSATQQQKAPENERIGPDHPLEGALGEAEIHLDRGKRDVHDHDVEHDHELHHAQEGECESLALVGDTHRVHPFVDLVTHRGQRRSASPRGRSR